MTDYIPPPGSKEAIEAGCICATWDNRYGYGIWSEHWQQVLYYYTADCPVHNADGKSARVELTGGKEHE